LEFDFKYDGLGMGTLAFGGVSGIGRGGTGVLKVGGKEVARPGMERTIPFILHWDESLDMGSDTLAGVNDAAYQPAFAFNGKINNITLSIDRPQLSPADAEKLKETAAEKKAAD
jgi:hypothetical protein